MGYDIEALGPVSILEATHGPREYAVLERIAALPGVVPRFILSPESTFDKKGALTGYRFETTGDSPVAYPGLVPDNGCGYFLFFIRRLPNGFAEWSALAQSIVSRAGLFSQYRRNAVGDSFLEAGVEGAFYFDIKPRPFLKELLADREFRLMAKQPFGCVLGHFFEIRRIDDGSGDHIGVIHSGSQGMHRLLNNRLHEKYRYHSRVYGAPLQTEEGQDRRQAALFALNYSRASRFAAYRLVRTALEKLGSATEIISDVFHSFIEFGENSIVHYRGIQDLGNPRNYAPHPYFLLAGSQKTTSYLVAPHAGGLMSHGTPEVFYSRPDCRPKAVADTLEWFDHSHPEAQEPSLLESVTAELLEDLVDRKAVRLVASLPPVLNMQVADGGYRKQVAS